MREHDIGGRKTSGASTRRAGRPARQKGLRINPEVMRGVSPLYDLDKVEVVQEQSARIWARWSEGVMIHVIGSGVVALIVFFVGIIITGYGLHGP